MFNAVLAVLTVIAVLVVTALARLLLFPFRLARRLLRRPDSQ